MRFVCTIHVKKHVGSLVAIGCVRLNDVLTTSIFPVGALDCWSRAYPAVGGEIFDMMDGSRRLRSIYDPKRKNALIRSPLGI